MSAGFEEGSSVKVVYHLLLTNLERKNYLDLEGVISGMSTNIGINGEPRYYLVKFEGYDKPVRIYPKCLELVGEKL